jgi:hypothetical protein
MAWKGMTKKKKNSWHGMEKAKHIMYERGCMRSYALFLFSCFCFAFVRSF